jgi:hypothetical protein
MGHCYQFTVTKKGLEIKLQNASIIGVRFKVLVVFL